MGAMTPTQKRNRRRIKRIGPPPAPPIKYPRELDTYRDPMRLIERYAATEPSATNGDVEIIRYHVTIERIDEPAEVLHARLLKLWRTSEPNHHNWDPMREAARAIGMDPALLTFDTQGIEHPRHHRNVSRTKDTP